MIARWPEQWHCAHAATRRAHTLTWRRGAAWPCLRKSCASPRHPVDDRADPQRHQIGVGPALVAASLTVP